jgi:hypothetical protein
MLISLHPACGGLIPLRDSARGEVKELDMSAVRHLPPLEIDDGITESISIEEFDFYCTLFEELLNELERRERMDDEDRGSFESNAWSRAWDIELEALLDEFDYAEIEEMREHFGIAKSGLAAMPSKNVWL